MFNDPNRTILPDRHRPCRGVFCVEGPMTDDRPWEAASRFARNNEHRIVFGPTGADRDALAAEFRRAHNNLAGVPPGSILRSIQ
jgi:hypothetical protein